MTAELVRLETSRVLVGDLFGKRCKSEGFGFWVLRDALRAALRHLALETGHNPILREQRNQFEDRSVRRLTGDRGARYPTTASPYTRARQIKPTHVPIAPLDGVF